MYLGHWGRNKPHVCVILCWGRGSFLPVLLHLIVFIYLPHVFGKFNMLHMVICIYTMVPDISRLIALPSGNPIGEYVLLKSYLFVLSCEVGHSETCNVLILSFWEASYIQVLPPRLLLMPQPLLGTFIVHMENIEYLCGGGSSSVVTFSWWIDKSFPSIMNFNHLSLVLYSWHLWVGSLEELYAWNAL